ncbi:hypothetical protein ACLOJK_027927 [Asimina triloba]
MGAVGKYTKGWIWWLIVLLIAGLVVTAAVITIRRKSGGSKGAAEPVPGPPGAITKKYADALKIALQFFDVQKCWFMYRLHRKRSRETTLTSTLFLDEMKPLRFESAVGQLLQLTICLGRFQGCGVRIAKIWFLGNFTNLMFGPTLQRLDWNEGEGAGLVAHCLGPEPPEPFFHGLGLPNLLSGDSALDDGKEAKLDLSKGMYDAGDHMKFNFPMAFTATVLSWAILEYGDQMAAVKQLESAQDSLKWITDYLIKCHPSDNVLYIQVGDPDIDHKCWERPEDMTEKRPLTQVNTSSPGSDVAAETAAAMAAASLVFKTSDHAYSDTLIRHSKQLFEFADTYRSSYSMSIPEVQGFYNSTGYKDELLWAAAWLYHATGDVSYLNYAAVKNGNAFADWGRPSWFSWDNKLAGVQWRER